MLRRATVAIPRMKQKKRATHFKCMTRLTPLAWRCFVFGLFAGLLSVQNFLLGNNGRFWIELFQPG